jgi:chemotaxis protein MotB
LVVATLMIFILAAFLRETLSVEEIKTLIIRHQQEEFSDVFEDAFRAEIYQKTIEVKRDQGFLQITFSNRVLFEEGDYDLSLEGAKLLARVANTLGHAQNTRYDQIQVEGHTDTTPLRSLLFPRDNWELSTARALEVMRYLIDHGTLPRRIYSATGYGEFRPVANNETTEGRAINRRIELRIVFSESGDSIGNIIKPNQSAR